MDNSEQHRESLEQFKREIVAKKLELGKCIRKQEELETRISQLQEITVAIARLLGEEYVLEDAMGLTDVIRQAFKTEPNNNMTAMEVRGKLQKMGFDITQYGNALASIHTVLTRLHAKKEIKQTAVRSNGRPAFQLVPQINELPMVPPVSLPSVSLPPPPGYVVPGKAAKQVVEEKKK
jgi:hypothetical protein